MADIWDDVTEQVDRLVPLEEGVKCYVQNIEYVKGDNMTQTRFLLVGIKGADGIHRELSQNLPDPFSGDVQYHGKNLIPYLMLFDALSPVKDSDVLKAQIRAELGNEFTHEQLHNCLVKVLDPNYQTVECEYRLIYPIKNGVASAYASKPTVGNFIKSKYRNKDLTPFNPEYMSLVPGARGGNKKPDSASSKAVAAKDDF